MRASMVSFLLLLFEGALRKWVLPSLSNPLLIIRDLMVRAYRSFKEFEGAGQGIATNILADRLQRLEAAGIITAGAEKADGRKVRLATMSPPVI